MKKIKLEGEFSHEIKKDMDRIDSLKRSIISISGTIRELEVKMWDMIKLEYKDISDNCTLSQDKDEVILTDRLTD